MSDKRRTGTEGGLFPRDPVAYERRVEAEREKAHWENEARQSAKGRMLR